MELPTFTDCIVKWYSHSVLFKPSISKSTPIVKTLVSISIKHPSDPDTEVITSVNGEFRPWRKTNSLQTLLFRLVNKALDEAIVFLRESSFEQIIQQSCFTAFSAFFLRKPCSRKTFTVLLNRKSF